MKTSEQINELATALSNFQAEAPMIGKTAQGYGYKYATLDDMLEQTRPLLTKHGLSFCQMPTVANGNGVALATRLMHKSGQWIEDVMEIPAPAGKNINDAQAYGSGLTYARRYAYSAMLGIATEEDTDGRPKAEASAKAQNPIPRQAVEDAADYSGNGQRPEAPLDWTGLEVIVRNNAPGVLARIAEMSDRWESHHPVKATLKNLGYPSWPAGDDKADQRWRMAQEAISYAQLRNAGMDGEAAVDAIAKKRLAQEATS